MTGSKETALNFGKEHSKVIRSIENAMINEPSQNWLRYFIPNEYRDAQGKPRKEYLLTRDGFSLLVMGFTGQKALQWKLKYIEAFNAMDQTLKSGKLSVDPMQLQCIKETNKTLKFIQDKNLRDHIARQLLSKLYEIDIAPEASGNTTAANTSVADFINSYCEKETGAVVKIGKLYETYESWCGLTKQKPLTKINFGREIVLLGFDRIHIAAGRCWSGIRLKTERKRLNDAACTGTERQ